jgi:hypothetical protein
MVALHMVKQSVIKKSGGLCLIARPDPGDSLIQDDLFDTMPDDFVIFAIFVNGF